MKTSRFSWEMIVAGLALTVATAIILEESSSRSGPKDDSSAFDFEASDAPDIPEPPAPPRVVKVSKKSDGIVINVEGVEDPEELKQVIRMKTAQVEEKLASLRINNAQLKEALQKVTIRTEDGSLIVLGNLDSAAEAEVYEKVMVAVQDVAAPLPPEMAEKIAVQAAAAASASKSYSYSYSYSSSGASASSGEFKPTFTANGEGVEQVAMSTMGGNISVTASDDESIRFMVKPSRPGVTDEEVNQLFDIRYVNDGESVRVEVDRRSNEGNVNFGINITAQIPSGKKISGVTKGGNLTVSDYSGKAMLSTKGGNVSLADFDGDLEAITRGGNITLTDVTGRLNIETSGGNIELNDVSADLKAHTNGGNVRMLDVSGSLNASTNGGNITTTLSELSGPCDLKTNAGNIDIEIPEGEGAEVLLKGMEVAMPAMKFDGVYAKTKAEGRINNGGPMIKAVTSVGRVSIRQ